MNTANTTAQNYFLESLSSTLEKLNGAFVKIRKYSKCRALYKSEPSIHVTKVPLLFPSISVVVLGDSSLYHPLEVLSLLLSSHQRRF